MNKLKKFQAKIFLKELVNLFFSGQPKPESLVALGLNQTSIDVSWVDSCSQLDGCNQERFVVQYRIYYTEVDENIEMWADTIRTSAPNSPPKSLVISNLTSNTEYILRVVSLAQQDNSFSDDSDPANGVTGLKSSKLI